MGEKARCMMREDEEQNHDAYVAMGNIPVVQTKAWCPTCQHHQDPANQECERCEHPIPDRYRP